MFLCIFCLCIFSWLGEFGYQYQCKWLPGKTCLQNKCHSNPLEFRGSYSTASNNMKLVQLHWPLMDGLLHLGTSCSPPRPILAVPNVTVHPSTASVPITVLLYNGPLLCGFDVAIKGLNSTQSTLLRYIWMQLHHDCLKLLTVAVWCRNFSISSAQTDCSRSCQMYLTVVGTCLPPEKGYSYWWFLCYSEHTSSY